MSLRAWLGLAMLPLSLLGGGTAQAAQNAAAASADKTELAARQRQVEQLDREVKQLEAARQGGAAQLAQRDREIAELRQRLARRQAAATAAPARSAP